jgi:hypothetical protein
MRDLQGAIYRFEEGGGARIVRVFLALLAFCAVAFYYDSRFYKNFHTEESMDVGQLARNLAEGRGFTTSYIRPFSLYLLGKHGENISEIVNRPHPDLANAPVYPLFLAGLMKVLPFHFDITAPEKRNFATYQPETIIIAANQVLFLLSAIVLFRLAASLFDKPIAWISTVGFVGSEVYWKLSSSGISTNLLILFFLGVVRLLIALDEESRAESPRGSRMFWLAAALGAVVAAGALTRYAFGWVLAPILLFIAVFFGARRWSAGLVTLAMFFLLVSPWLYRNFALCGNCLGMASYAACETTAAFPEDRLVRSMDPSKGLREIGIWDYTRKLLANTHEIVQTKLPTLGASWLFLFFIPGLLVAFQNPVLSRLRFFLLVLVPLFVVVEALGRTHLSLGSDGIDSENLLVVFAPATFIFGASFLCALAEPALEQIPQLRVAALSALATLAAAPFLFGLLDARVYPVAYPPYYPPALRIISGWMKPEEQIMTDIPWAVAWYGRRAGVALSLDAKGEFDQIRAESKDLKAVLLSANFFGKSFRELVSSKTGWGRLAFGVFVDRKAPPGFPFPAVCPALLPEEVLLGDSPRWELLERDK